MNRKPPGTSGTFARGNAEVYPRALEDAEIKAIDARRSQVNMAASGDITNTVGLALSGGGIRSATFCLGFLQALARGKLLSKIDLLSTVSGGGYTGIFLGGLFVRRGCAETVREELVDPRSSVNSWLRKNGRYLAPNGAGDFLTALAVQVRNWLSVIAALGILTLTLFLLGNCVQAWLRGFHWWDTHTNRLFAMPESWQFWWLSPCFLLVILGALGSGVLIGCFWFVPAGRTRFVTRAPLVILVVLSILGLVKYSLPPEHAWRAGAWMMFKVTAVLTIALWLLARLGYTYARAREAFVRAGSGGGKESPSWQERAQQVWDRIRSAAGVLWQDREHLLMEANRWERRFFSAWLARVLAFTGGILIFACIDTLGQSLYLSSHRGGATLGLNGLLGATGLAGVFSIGPTIWNFIARAKKQVPLGTTTIATALAFALLGALLVSTNLLAHATSWGWNNPESLESPSWRTLGGATVLAVVLCFAVGRCFYFLNGSSLQLLYGSRLARAYLGASLTERQDPRYSGVTSLIRGEDMFFDRYAPHDYGGPLHLINTTLNETCGGESDLDQRDRRGLSLAVSSCGLNVGRRDHGTWVETSKPGTKLELKPCPEPASTRFRVFPASEYTVENISVGHWAALSGAAIGTGLGFRTCVGLSLLAGLGNLRLGYWWDSAVPPLSRPSERRRPMRATERCALLWAWLFPVQSYLLDEWLARFHGTARRHWYLSDGGHFENTAAYELIRRRVRHIVCCDCGCDAGYSFEDVAALVRKARIDFNAEIEFFNAGELQALGKQIPSAVGTPEDFQKQETRKFYATLARVRYDGKPTADTLILFVKPAVAGGEPLDVTQYQHSHEDFPHESTGDQFFDEAQWESYRELGDHSGSALLQHKKDGDWWFTALVPGDFPAGEPVPSRGEVTAVTGAATMDK